MSRPTVWYFFVVIFSSMAVAHPVSAASKGGNRGDPKTTYDQSENQAHSGKGGSTTEAVSTSSQASSASTSTTDQPSAAGHWLVRRVTSSSGGRWTLYDTGEVKHVSGL